MQHSSNHKMTYSEAGKLGNLKSKITQAKQKEERKIKYYENPKCCKQCGEVIPYEKRDRNFCNSSCAAVWNNTHRRKRERICENCGKSFHQKVKNAKFCCRNCVIEFHKNKHYEKLLSYIKETGEFPVSEIGIIKGETKRYSVRKYLEKTQGHKCAICGVTEWLGKPIPLVVDHIDGNSSNHKVDNFRLICNNCDSLLPTFKGANKGSGRTFRKKYS